MIMMEWTKDIIVMDQTMEMINVMSHNTNHMMEKIIETNQKILRMLI